MRLVLLTIPLMTANLLACEYTQVVSNDDEWARMVYGITAAECTQHFPTPFKQDDGSACDLPAEASDCTAIDWDQDDDPDHGHACFGFSEDLKKCTKCNILDLPNTGDDKWTECRNQQYMDCLMNDHLQNYGDLCFVTKLECLEYDKPRVTVREVCYYRQKTGNWPPTCPSEASCAADAGTCNDAGTDAGDAGDDAGDDAGGDAGDDAGGDAGDDAGGDAGDDAGTDGGMGMEVSVEMY